MQVGAILVRAGPTSFHRNGLEACPKTRGSSVPTIANSYPPLQQVASLQRTLSEPKWSHSFSARTKITKKLTAAASADLTVCVDNGALATSTAWTCRESPFGGGDPPKGELQPRTLADAREWRDSFCFSLDVMSTILSWLKSPQTGVLMRRVSHRERQAPSHQA